MNVDEIVKTMSGGQPETVASLEKKLSNPIFNYTPGYLARVVAEMDEALYLLAGRVVELEAEMSKFKLCESSTGCSDEEGMVHTVRQTPGSALRSAQVRKVYHKAGE